MFGKKKKGKEENQEEQANETGEKEKPEEGAVSADGNEGASAGKAKPDAPDLKPTLIIAVIAMISVVFAFVFVSKMNSTPIVNEADVEETESGDVTSDSESGDAPKVDADKREKKKKKKEGKDEKGEDAGDSDGESGVEGEAESQGNIIVPLESIVVNLGGIGSRRYLRVLINLEVANEEAKGKINEKIVMLRDKMISLLSAKSAKEIETEGDLLRLRLEIKNILNEVLGAEEIIIQVYFSDFIIQ
ncbi:MAG: hypothetical protein GY941_23315 [Planctomycetes bacterium]|nr:hypothetical protein [Planctomycetota bacterium]